MFNNLLGWGWGTVCVCDIHIHTCNIIHYTLYGYEGCVAQNLQIITKMQIASHSMLLLIFVQLQLFVTNLFVSEHSFNMTIVRYFLSH